MSPGSRIIILSALMLAGCQSATKQPIPPVRASIAPGADARSLSRADVSRADASRPVVNSADFQTSIPSSPSPQPYVMPPVHVPTIPTTTYPTPVPTEPSAAPVPPSAPGLSDTPSPPTVEGPSEGIVMPSLFEKK